MNVVSPYQSTWSCTDNLYDAFPQHWAGSTVGYFGMIRVDGEVYRWLGPPGNSGAPSATSSVTQLGVSVAPLTTTCKCTLLNLSGDTLLCYTV